MPAPTISPPSCPPLIALAPTAPRRLEAESEALRHAARQLREEANGLVDALRAVVDFDRPDVWSGARCDRFRQELADVARRLCSPTTGVAVELLETAARFEHRALWLDSLAVGPPTACD